MLRIVFSLLQFMAVIQFTASPVFSQCREFKLFSEAPVTSEFFGNSVSVDKKMAVIGAPELFRKGSAFVFQFDSRKTGWKRIAKLEARPESMPVGRFGTSVAIMGKIVVVGSPGSSMGINDRDSGAAYVYRFEEESGQWFQVERLIAADGEKDDLFGTSVSITGHPGKEVIIIGAFRDDDRGNNAGSAYIFRYNAETLSWNEEVKLLPLQNSTGALFGLGVSITGHSGQEAVVISATLGRGVANTSGVAYIFRHNPGDDEWMNEAILLDPNGRTDDRFGASVAISGRLGREVVMVGTTRSSNRRSNPGAVFVYRYDQESSQWDSEQLIEASDGRNGDLFGKAIAISGLHEKEIAIVSARDPVSGSGHVYLFRYDRNSHEWREKTKILHLDAWGSGSFGDVVSSSGAPGNEVILIGDSHDFENGSRAGAAHILDMNCRPLTKPTRTQQDRITPDVSDIVNLLAKWGICDEQCSFDNNKDGIVNIDDLLSMLLGKQRRVRIDAEGFPEAN